MRLIISRKGFDSGYGGCASPIFPDGTMASLPIPSSIGTPFSALCVDDVNLGEVVQDLTRSRRKRITRDDGVHLDPDLDRALIPRAKDWRPAFGQAAAAQSHLHRHGVGPGDVFLFFGWFRRVQKTNGCWTYTPEEPDLHVFFGWLQIAEVLSLNSIAAKRDVIKRYPWLRRHPHLDENWEPKNNSIYVSQPRLELGGKRVPQPGAGVFRRFHALLQLTWPGHSRRYWRLPRWIAPTDGRPPLTYHRKLESWDLRDDVVRLRSVGKGQEFVLDCEHYPEACDWVSSLISTCA